MTQLGKTPSADRLPDGIESQLHVALDNMPGALVYTDDALNIVLCNTRFMEMYPVPKELLAPGRPYPSLLRYLAEHGYYGDGDVETHVSRRVESLSNPTGIAFEDHAPNGNVYRVVRNFVLIHRRPKPR